MSAPDYEKLGVFYLGSTYDIERRERQAELLLYDSKDLVTHAVCVGMTGSGKTGLCIGLLEEAAIDGIPAIVIDPKGDLPNLLLTFPELRGEQFAPWVNEDDARRQNLSVPEYAEQQAARWRQGLQEWSQGPDRIARLKSAAEFAVYTPGSSAGRPVSVLKSFEAPPAEIIEDSDAFADRVSSTASSLLGLVGIQSDPLQSREHILLATILGHAWGRGESLDLAGLIQSVQSPPISRVGVMDLEAFYPSKDRFALAVQLNALAASPGFGRWLDGEPLDLHTMLHAPSGKPRICIFSIAHLNDAERMFFVSLLLNQTLGWVRTQSGTTTLRALLYMDEIAGYFPPVANPPSKRPLLLLMKQARAFGLGVVLATQNPVDLDYKGLANAGTWFIGRLQTERDMARVMDGLEGAAASASAAFDRSAIERLLGRLGQRVFLMNNVHDATPAVFQTRWTLSYLRGPCTREQIKRLTESQGTAAPAPAPLQAMAAAGGAPAASNSAANGLSAQPPMLGPGISQYFLPLRAGTGSVVYRPMLLGCGRIYYSDPRAAVDEEVPVSRLAALSAGPVTVDWESSEEVDLLESYLEPQPAADASFAGLPPDAASPKALDASKKAFLESLFRGHTLELLSSRSLSLRSRPRESERDFRVRLAHRAREDRDLQSDRLRQKYAPRLQALQDRLRRAQQARQVQEDQARQARLQTAVSFGSAILSAFLGRKTLSSGNVGRAATAVRGAGRAMRESGDIQRAQESVEAIEAQRAALESQFQAEVDALAAKADAAAEALEPVVLRPKKANVAVRAVVLAWAPFRVGADGQESPAWT